MACQLPRADPMLTLIYEFIRRHYVSMSQSLNQLVSMEYSIGYQRVNDLGYFLYIYPVHSGQKFEKTNIQYSLQACYSV